jgi:hypothetical protein
VREKKRFGVLTHFRFGAVSVKEEPGKPWQIDTKQGAGDARR